LTGSKKKQKKNHPVGEENPDILLLLEWRWNVLKWRWGYQITLFW
jgi:hypothetical protein